MREPYMYFFFTGLPLHVVYTWILMFALVAVAFLVKRSLRWVPVGGQNVFEWFFGGMLNFIDNVMGHHGKAYFPLLATLGIFIFTANVMALIPGFMSPTANINTTAACAVTVFLMTHYIGFKTHGFSYLKQFTGPIWWLAPLMFVVEIIGHLARPLSLSVRLFGNIFGDDQVVINFFVLAILFKWLYLPVVVPSVMLVFAIFIAFIQTFVFVLLSMIYLAGALEEHH
ncbi:MAG: F0F1 ATP synthase subunit A [Nitrospinota bacterium]